MLSIRPCHCWGRFPLDIMIWMITEWLSEWVNERPSDRVTKWLGDWVTGWQDDRKLRRRLTGWYILISTRPPRHEYCSDTTILAAASCMCDVCTQLFTVKCCQFQNLSKCDSLRYMSYCPIVSYHVILLHSPKFRYWHLCSENVTKRREGHVM